MIGDETMRTPTGLSSASVRDRFLGECDGVYGGFGEAAGIVRERGIDAGLHLNFTTAYSAASRRLGLLRIKNELQDTLRVTGSLK